MVSEVAGNHSREEQYFRDVEQLVVNHLLFSLLQMCVLGVLLSDAAIAVVVAGQVAEQDRIRAVGNIRGNVATADLAA